MQMKMTGEMLMDILTHLNLFVDDQDKRLLEDLQSVFLKLYERLWRYQLRFVTI
jgi:hypothetical protein